MVELGEAAEFRWYRPRQATVRETQDKELGEVAEFGWYRPRQLIAAEKKVGQVGEVAEFGWYWPCHRARTFIEAVSADAAAASVCIDVAAAQAEDLKIVKIAQFGGYRARHAVHSQMTELCKG
ncbi:MAG: hypothetical protein F4Z64_05320 [Acidimicrobiaceae bacterium]|nr:hypothetical protein [Acidimicrobiaceae bacterium]